MDHNYIEEYHVADRYLRNGLSPEERKEFERHFVDCPECLDRLALAEIFRHGEDGEQNKAKVFQVVVAAPPAQTPRPRLMTEWIAQFAGWQWALILAAAGLLLVSVPTGYFLWQLSVMNQQLAGTSTPNSAAVFTLTPGSEKVLVAPENVRHWVVLSPEISRNPEFTAYRAAISVSDGRTIWTASNLRLALGGAPGITVPSSIFQPDSYVLTLEGLTRKGEYIFVAQYPFRVVRAP